MRLTCASRADVFHVMRFDGCQALVEREGVPASIRQWRRTRRPHPNLLPQPEEGVNTGTESP